MACGCSAIFKIQISRMLPHKDILRPWLNVSVPSTSSILVLSLFTSIIFETFSCILKSPSVLLTIKGRDRAMSAKPCLGGPSSKWFFLRLQPRANLIQVIFTRFKSSLSAIGLKVSFLNKLSRKIVLRWEGGRNEEDNEI